MMLYIDRYYCWLRSVFKDDDNFFGSRQLYLMSLTILNYSFFLLLLIIKVFIDKDLINNNKTAFTLITLFLLFIIVKLVYSRYRRFVFTDIGFSIAETLVNVVVFFIPYIVLVVLFYGK